MAGFDEAIPLLLRTIAHVALIALPGFAAAALVSLRSRTYDVILAGLTALVGIAVSGYLAFWVWFFSPRVGLVFTFCLPIISIACLLWSVRRLDTASRSTLKALLVPMALTGSAALLVLSTGFIFGGLNAPIPTASVRFSHPLPGDNEIPYLVAQGIRKGNVPKPLLVDWLSSDRPPLQTAIVLAQSLPHPAQLEYTVVSVLCQSLWIFALWLFLTTFDLDSKCNALALIICLFSGFVFLNSFYVWPKLLAAAYMIAFSAVLLAPRFSRALQETALLPVIAGALACFGLLAHGASAFALIGLVSTMFALRKRVSFRSLVLMSVTFFCLYLPWTLYQKLYDPPGDRLLKYHLAGVLQVDPRSFTQALIGAYRNLTFQEFLHNKLANAAAILDHQAEYWRSIVEFIRDLAQSNSASAVQIASVSTTLKGLFFFYFIPALGFLVPGLAALVLGVHRRFRSREWKLAATIWLYIALTDVAWCLLMFIPRMTVIHTGSYAIILLAYSGSVLALWSVSQWLAILLASLQIEINFLLYVAFMRPPTAGPLRFATAGLALLTLICSLIFLKMLARRPRRAHAS